MNIYLNHLKSGFEVSTHKGKSVVSTLNSTEFDKFLESLDSLEFDVGIVPPGFEHRADLISNTFYDTPSLDWLILWFNGIADPFQELNTGDEIKIPRI